MADNGEMTDNDRKMDALVKKFKSDRNEIFDKSGMYSFSSIGGSSLEVDIIVFASKEIPKSSSDRLISNAAYELFDALLDAGKKAQSKKEFPDFKEQVVGMFRSAGLPPVYLHAKENEYSKNGIPWVDVYTKIGPVTVGWRKSVVVLSWEGTVIAKQQHETTSQDLFPGEDVTKGVYMIHAHGYESLARYISVLGKTASKFSIDVGVGGVSSHV